VNAPLFTQTRSTTKERNIMKAFSNPNNPLNTYRHIFFVPARGDFRLSMPGRDTTFHDSVTDAVRVRDAVLNSKPAPGPTPLTPDFYHHERRVTYGQ
jgi:hypothetical protein